MMKHFLSACTLLLAVTTSSAQTFFLDDNGITIKCIDCVSGDTGIVNGIEYTAVDNASLQAAVDDGLIPLNQLCTSLVTSTYSLFLDKTTFNEDISNWDMSSVTSMYRMFENAKLFNQSLNAWDVSSVTNMGRMFFGAESFDMPLDAWDVSIGPSMAFLFWDATAFNQDIGSWDVSNVTDMYALFHGAASFNQSINEWDVSNVVNWVGMFNGASSFNQSLDNWSVPSGVISMSNMFRDATAFNQPLNHWDVSSVTDMFGMFRGAESFDQPLDSWNMGSVSSTSNMFRGASSFNQNLESWDVSNVTNMSYMFRDAAAFNKPLVDWNVSNVTNMSNMFHTAVSFNQSLNGWDVSSVVNMNYLFENAQSFNQPLNNWDVSSVESMVSLFAVTPLFNQPLNQWDLSSVMNMTYMFYRALAFDQDISNWCVTGVASEPSLFNLDGVLSLEHFPVWGECPGCSENLEWCLDGPLCNPGFGVFPSEIPDHSSSNQSCWQGSLMVSDPANVNQLVGFYINIEHSFLGDLDVTFICPNGQDMLVSSYPGPGTSLGIPDENNSPVPGTGYDYFWSANAPLDTWANEISDGGALESGTYTSEMSWDVLDGCPLNGVWQLEVCDLWASDNGFVFDWGIVLENENGEISMQTASCATSLGCLDESACNYDSEADYDNGQCEYVDECGICGGEGAIYECGCWPEGDCDCNGNQLDAVGVCGGDCAADADADGICDDVDDCVGEFDACGVCNGPGPIFECGCFEVPEGNCDCESIDSDGDGICDSEDDCFSLEEDTGSCCELAIAQFVCSFNGIGSCSDTLNVAGWQELDSLEIYFYFPPASASWPEDLALQIVPPTGDSILMGGWWYGIEPSDVGGEFLGDGDEVWGWPSGSDEGVFTQVVDLSSYDLFGEGVWVVKVWNTIANVSHTWQVDVVLHGVCGQEGVSCVNDADGDGICDFEDDCIGEYDTCGICNGEGPTLACGCDPVPEGACDCEGNQLDALGVCGGDCVSDVNGNGICDLEELSESGESMCGQGTVWDESLGVCVVAVPTDANFDGCVSINDLLELLAFYGTCP